MYSITCSMVCKMIFCSKFPDILDKAGRKTTRRRTQAVAKSYAFHANAKRQHFYAHKKYLRGRKLVAWRFVLFTFYTLFTLFVLFVLFVIFVLFVLFMLFVVFGLSVLLVLFVCVKSSCKKKK